MHIRRQYCHILDSSKLDIRYFCWPFFSLEKYKRKEFLGGQRPPNNLWLSRLIENTCKSPINTLVQDVATRPRGLGGVVEDAVDSSLLKAGILNNNFNTWNDLNPNWATTLDPNWSLVCWQTHIQAVTITM